MDRSLNPTIDPTIDPTIAPEYREWLQAATESEDGHYYAHTGISLGGIILVLIVLAILF